jgi:hypothetical protein
MPKRPMKTVHDGENDERSKWLSKLRRDRAGEFMTRALDVYIRGLIAWGKLRSKRNKARRGGA